MSGTPGTSKSLLEDAPAVTCLKLLGQGKETLFKHGRGVLLVDIFQILELLAENLTECQGLDGVMAELLKNFFRGKAWHGGLFSACSSGAMRLLRFGVNWRAEPVDRAGRALGVRLLSGGRSLAA